MNLCSAILAHILLREQLQKMGVLGCVSCIVGSVVIVIHAPQEHTPNSVQEIWNLATQPGIILYNFSALPSSDTFLILTLLNASAFLFN